MEPPFPEPFGRACRLADVALLILMVAAAFTLGCQELSDSDIWWHVRAGQWIWDNHAVPDRDPFTFASADRSWIDLHWLFQVILAAAFAAGGVPGMILMTAGVCAAVFLVGLTARDRDWPSWVVAICWLPALLVMSARFAPRPEILSLLSVALYLAVLRRTDEAPELAWALPVIQVVWVNVHGLFVLGPLIMGAYLIDHLSRAMHERAWAGPQESLEGKSWWKHIGGATVCVGAACLANPYGLRGVLLPLELFPKITAWGGLYKSYIAEFMDLQAFVQKQGFAAAGNLFIRAECFLLWVLPLSFLVPAMWRAAAKRAGGTSPVQAMAWCGGFSLAVSLILACVLGFPGLETPWWMIWLGRSAPIGLVALGTLATALLVRSSRAAALLAATGSAAVASWVVWLRASLLGPESGPSAWFSVPGAGSPVSGCLAAVLGAVAAGLILRGGGRLFGMVLVAAFGYLALQGFRNINFFGLTAGFVLAGNLGPWAAELADAVPASRCSSWSWSVAGTAARIALAALAGLLIVTTMNGRFFRATGEPRRFSLHASPLAYAHEAARFAGRPGLPDRALVFDLRQAGVYLFHNGPQRKLFLDGRLEVPGRETFETYVRLDHMLNDGRRGWAEPIRRMGDPLILLDHELDFGAEATLLVDPAWRCIYYDAIASVFVSRRRSDLAASFPSVDFAARHFQFRDTAWQAAPPVPWGLAKAKALLDLASVVRFRTGPTWQLPLSLSLLAGDHLHQAIASNPASARSWTELGIASWNMVPDLMAPFPGPDESWDPARGLLPAQATFCCRRALEMDPKEIMALYSLLQAFQARRMNDAERSAAALMHGAWTAAVADADADASRNRLPIEAREEPQPGWDRVGRDGLSRTLADLLQEGRALAAVRLFAEGENRGIVPEWSTCDRVATTLLHLGRPADARRIWEQTPDPPSQALQLARIATAELVALNFPNAERTYRAALKLDPGLGEAWFGLALLYTERGERSGALAACREGLRQPLTAAQTMFLEGLQTLAAPPEQQR
jgi:tetratricopeptide (TPR) repeat protein